MEYTIAKMRDKLRIYEKTGKITATYFLTPREIQEIISMLKGYAYTLSGGFDEAERRIIILGNEKANLSEYLTVIRIESFEKELHHRSVLGSVLGLGIKREMIGDIIVKENISDVIIIREMKEFILSHLQKVGSSKVAVREVMFKELLTIEGEKEVKMLSIASLRIDVIISTAFGVSREKSSSLITQEKALLNFFPCLNGSKFVKEGDLISVRGFGRVKVLEVIRGNKKR